MPKPEQDYKALLKRSLIAIEQLKTRIAALEGGSHEPIAIVGVGCRIPGGANDMDAFWELIAGGGDTVTEVPPERWDADEYYDPDPDAGGKTYSRWGSFLKDVDRFDADFFGISPREAVSMDPQQRILLEVAWEAMEHAGIAPARLVGSQTGVYMGMTTHDYSNRIIEAKGTYHADAYAASGTAHSAAAGRLSYVFGFHGPNVAMDTACSSSLVATHMAIQALRNGEIDAALAGGVNLTLSPDGAIHIARGRMASFEGHCKTFDASADGYVRGEGCVVLVLKRLSDAQRDNDRVLAVIRGTALNHDGRSSGLTAPFGPAQEAVIRAALANGKLAPKDVSYVEAHGTGTPLGDPIEMKALGEVYGRARDRNSPLMVGGVKTNIGHVEGAAGVAGMLKVVLALQHQTIPPHLHLNTPNPLIPWDEYPITVPTTLTPWEAPVRRAGVSSFGFSGTNAHMIIEEPPVAEHHAVETDRPRHLLPLSARTPEALAELVNRYVAYLANADAAPFADVAATAAMGRSHFHERLAIVASSNEAAREKLLAVSAGEIGPGIARARAEGGSSPDVVFLFTGQGAQRAGMARQLYDSHPTFRRTLDLCAAIADRYLDVPLLSVIFADDATDRRIDETAYTQPALFAVEYALAQLWRSWGVEPTVVLGHSVGEYVAACVAGVFSLEDGLRLITARGRLMGSLPRTGSMAAVFASEERVIAAIAGARDRVSIAGVNGPQNTVIAGETTAIDTILAQLAADGIEFQKLNVSHAFHSPLMEPILDEFEAIASSVVFSPPSIGLVSNVTGRMAGEEITTSGYWRRHVREAVRFSDSLAEVHRAGYHVFLEIGPSPTLLGIARRCLPAEQMVYASSLDRARDDWESMLDALGKLYVHGARIDWAAFDRDYADGRQRVSLPTYPFQRDRFWLEVGAARTRHHLNPLRHPHPLLNGRVPGAADIFEARISLDAFPYLSDHQIAGLKLFPAAAYLETARAAAREVLDVEHVALREVSIQKALTIPDQGAVTIQVVISPSTDDTIAFQIFSAAEDADGEAPDWTLHVAGRATRASSDSAATIGLKEIQMRCTESVDVESYYGDLKRFGADYGPAFRGITEIRRGDGGVLGMVRLPDLPATTGRGYTIHPALLDSCFQLTGLALPTGDDVAAAESVYVPVSLAEFDVTAPVGSEVWCHVSRARLFQGGQRASGDLTVTDVSGRILATMRGLEFARVTRAQLDALLRERSSGEWLFETAWRALPLDTQRRPLEPGRWMIVAGADDTGSALADVLRERGHMVEVIVSADAPADRKGRRVDLANASEVRNVVAEMASMTDVPFHGTVHLSALDAVDDTLERTALAAIRATTERLLTGALVLVNALADSDARLWFVTRGSQPVAGSVPDVIQAPLWGFAGAVASEYPAMACTRIDLDPAGDTDEVRQLADAITFPDRELRIAFRSSLRHAARLVRSPLKTSSTGTTRGQLDNLTLAGAQGSELTPIRNDSTYLLTGGLGGLGLAVARSLASEGAKYLVLMGRSAPSPGAQDVLAELEQQGVTTVVACGDVASPSDVTRVLSDINATMPPLRGIIHAAGIVDDGMLPEQSWARMDRVLAPKVAGAWNLHTATESLHLDFFVLFSSGAALLGSPGQSNYAAANQFLDALAHARRANGLPALSINWGSWSDVGMAAGVGEQHRRRWAALGLGMIAPDTGVLVLRDLMERVTIPQVAVLPLTLSRLKSGDNPFYDELLTGDRSATRNVTAGNLHERLRSADANERVDLIASFLGEQLITVLALDSSYRVDVARSIMEMGIDSLMAMELRNRINTNLTAAISVAELLQGPSIRELAESIAERLMTTATDGSDARDQDEEAAALLAQVDVLSEDDLDSHLERLLTEQGPRR